MVTHSSILAWKIPWIEEPGGLQSMGSQRIRHDLATKQQQQVNPHILSCLFAFLSLGDGLDPCLLYNVMNLHP